MDYKKMIGGYSADLHLNQWVEMCHKSSKDAGWWEPPPNLFDGMGTRLEDTEWGQKMWRDLVSPIKMVLIHSEISEAMEGFRKDVMDDHLPHRKMAEVELADAFIRICDLAGAHGFDLMGAVREKMKYNWDRADHKPEARTAEGGKKF